MAWAFGTRVTFAVATFGRGGSVVASPRACGSVFSVRRGAGRRAIALTPR